MDFKGQFTDAATAKEFTLAGRALITLKSQKTGEHYTFRVKKTDNAERWFVSYLFGPDNESSYRYIGLIDQDGFRLTGKSALPADSLPVRAFKYAWGHIDERKVIAPNLEIWHEGKCGRCARTLTRPDSIQRGFGPECSTRITCEAA